MPDMTFMNDPNLAAAYEAAKKGIQQKYANQSDYLQENMAARGLLNSGANIENQARVGAQQEAELGNSAAGFAQMAYQAAQQKALQEQAAAAQKAMMEKQLAFQSQMASRGGGGGGGGGGGYGGGGGGGQQGGSQGPIGLTNQQAVGALGLPTTHATYGTAGLQTGSVPVVYTNSYVNNALQGTGFYVR